MPHLAKPLDDASSLQQMLTSIEASIIKIPGCENRDGLHREKAIFKLAMESMDEDYYSSLKRSRGKNVEDCATLRKSASRIFKSAGHCRNAHEQMWKLLSQSIAFAPNDSEELALAYKQRAELFSHLKKYQECIIDCDRAINITDSKKMKAELSDCKHQCSEMIRQKLEHECGGKLMNSIDRLSLDKEPKKTLVERMFAISHTVHDKNESQDDSDTDEEHNFEELPNFHSHSQAPSASEALEMNYSKKWGRHFIAARDIQPGEILAIEKSFHTFIQTFGQYTHCSNCAKAAWNNFPCKYCVYDVYCSDRCRGEAWIKYHQFECETYPYLVDTVEDMQECRTALKFMLLSVYKAGGIQRLAEEIIDNHQCTDLKSKGFLNTVFDSGSSKAANSLFYDEKLLEKNLAPTLVNVICIQVYLLARKSNFFGNEFDISYTDLRTNGEILFIGALLLKNLLMLKGLVFPYEEYYGQFFEESMNGVSLFPLCSLFNHSCDPNADYFTTRDNELVIFSRLKIEEGSQIFISYHRLSYLACTKKKRKQMLKGLYFTCKCQACAERWSNICAPSINDLLQSSPYLAHGVSILIENSQLVKLYDDVNKMNYTPERLDTVVIILETLSEKVSANSKEYIFFSDFMRRMLMKSFGNWFEIPDKC